MAGVVRKEREQRRTSGNGVKVRTKMVKGRRTDET